MVAGAESGFGATAQGLVLVENWHQELLERVPIP